MAADDQLVHDYLRRLEKEARILPKGQRRELVTDIEGHIAAARSQGSGEAYMRNVLDDLGDPDIIVTAALGPVKEAGPQTRDIVTIVLLLAGGVVIPVVGWLVGLVLLWASSSWTAGRKLLGTLVWPGGLLLAARMVVDPGLSLPQWVALVVLAALVVGPLIVSVDLFRQARTVQPAPGDSARLTG